MIILCAWCERTIRDDEVDDGDARPSHGICELCAPKLAAEIRSMEEDLAKQADAVTPLEAKAGVCCHGTPLGEWCTGCEAEV